MTDTKNNDHADQLHVFKETESLSTFTLNDEDGQQKTDDRRQIKTKKRKSSRGRASSMRTMILHFLWSSRRTFVLNAILCNITLSLLISQLLLDEAGCDGDPIHYQRPDLFESTQYQQQDLEPDYEQRQARQLDLAAIFGNQLHQQSTPISDANYPINQAGRPSSTNELAFMSNMIDQLNNQQPISQESRHQTQGYQSANSEADLLETAQTKAETNLASSTNDNNEKSSAGASTSLASAQTSSSTTASSSPSPLSEQLSVVSNLIQQAGQLGLSAAQQNVALSEAIINGVTNTLIRNNQNRKQSTPSPSAQSSAPSPTRPGHVVGQSIDGNIEYDSNSNTINGNIEFPNLNLNGKPGLSSAVKPILLAGLKVVPLKLGTIGWKLLQLLAWKKIYKTHHPKSGEIIIEQEMGKHNHGMSDKGSKLGNKISQHFGNKLKTSKMGQSYVNDDWMSMMKSTGAMNGGDMFSSGGWPQASNESPSASASMIYQRHLLPPNFSASTGQPAAAAAAAAAATAAAIQSHWMQQQSLMSEEGTATAESQQSRSNTTALAPGSAANALKRKKASFGGGNWYAATPAQAYVAAAAAANAAANLAASQQHQQHHHQRMAHMMRAFEMGANPDYMQMLANGPNIYSSGSNGLAYHQSLFDNAAAMAVQNAVKLPPADMPNPLATAEFLDQSDSLTGSSFGSPFSSMTNSISDQPEPMTLMQRHDTGSHQTNRISTGAQNFWSAHYPGSRSSTDSLLNENPRNNQRVNSILSGMADFDDTPAGKLLNSAMNESASYPDYRTAQSFQGLDK